MNINKNIKMKSTLSALAVVIMACGIMSCNKQPQANDTKETPKTAATTATAGSQQIAYVEIDSIMGQYKYWKEVTKILEAKEKNIQKTLAGKQQALQQRLGAEYQKEVAKYNKALSDSVHNYLKTYNKDKKYVMILAKSGDNILYADDACNITSDVLQGMNKAYTGLKK